MPAFCCIDKQDSARAGPGKRWHQTPGTYHLYAPLKLFPEQHIATANTPRSAIPLMESPSQQIAVFFTGGTIGMRQSADGAVKPALHLADLLSEMQAALPLCHGALPSLLPVDWADLPSPHMTPDLMFRLAMDVQAMLARPDIAGVVITHGTDVMEETAFMLDLLIDSSKPVVITGAMRSHGEAGYDGLRNLSSAIRACAMPLPAGLGVVLLMTDKLFAAREVTKIHSMGVDAFDSPGAGPLGSCVAGGIQLFRMPVPHTPVRTGCLESQVDLITLAPGMDGRLLACSRESGARGLVAEGFGAGNVPPGALEEIKKTVAAGVPVVITSRCIEGGVWPVYGYSGGANDLRDMGVILGGNLRAQKARILLMLALGKAATRHAEAGGAGLPPQEDALTVVRGVFEAFPN